MENKPKEFVLDVDVERLERIAFILKTVAHPIRLGIVRLLEVYPKMSVNEICEALDSEQSLTSHHLQNMKLKGVLSSKKDGRKMFYSLKERDVSLIIECLEDCKCNM
ncbi:MAG: ArsR/SmtB family transcription factor [Saprospiraceae bacterium]